MTAEDATGDGENVLTLQALIRARMDERGWGYADLARRSGDRLTRGRWQQLGTGVRFTMYPEPANLQLMADALEVDVTTVILAASRSLGLDARRRGPDFAQLLPAGVDQLPEQMRDGLLTIIRAAVAQAVEINADKSDDDGVDLTLEWTKSQSSTRRNGVANERDTTA